jgi:hypothetical protein
MEIMSRFPKFIAAGVLVLLSAGPVPAQQVKGPAGQGAQVQGQPVSPQGANYGGFNQNPWFGDQAVRSHLKFSADQYNGLNKAYGEAWTKYNSNLGQLGNTLTGQQRAKKLQDLQATFHRSVNASIERVLTDPQQRQRYEQLHLQYQGYGAFNDATLQQKLRLTDEQRQKFAQYRQEWHKQMGLYHQSYPTDPQSTTNRYNELAKQTSERFNSVLNEEQKHMWSQITGEPYHFPPSVHFVTVRPNN